MSRPTIEMKISNLSTAQFDVIQDMLINHTLPDVRLDLSDLGIENKYFNVYYVADVGNGSVLLNLKASGDGSSIIEENELLDNCVLREGLNVMNKKPAGKKAGAMDSENSKTFKESLEILSEKIVKDFDDDAQSLKKACETSACVFAERLPIDDSVSCEDCAETHRFEGDEPPCKNYGKEKEKRLLAETEQLRTQIDKLLVGFNNRLTGWQKEESKLKGLIINAGKSSTIPIKKIEDIKMLLDLHDTDILSDYNMLGLVRAVCYRAA